MERNGNGILEQSEEKDVRENRLELVVSQVNRSTSLDGNDCRRVPGVCVCALPCHFLIFIIAIRPKSLRKKNKKNRPQRYVVVPRSFG